jgi:hypothetical protein
MHWLEKASTTSESHAQHRVFQYNKPLAVIKLERVNSRPRELPVIEMPVSHAPDNAAAQRQYSKKTSLLDRVELMVLFPVSSLEFQLLPSARPNGRRTLIPDRRHHGEKRAKIPFRQISQCLCFFGE